MSDEGIAFELNQDILGKRAAFPCGCVLECDTHYPGRDWARTGFSIHHCTAHYALGVLGLKQFQHMEGRTDISVPNEMLGELECKWLHADGTPVVLDELERAMEEWVWRADANRIVVKEGRSAVAGLVDPWILSTERTAAIGRHGTVAHMPLEITRGKAPGDLLSVSQINRGRGKPVFIHDALLVDPADLTGDYKEIEKRLFSSLGLSKDMIFDKKTVSFNAAPAIPVGFITTLKEYHEKVSLLSVMKNRQYDTPPLRITFNPSWEEFEQAGMQIDTAINTLLDSSEDD